MEKRRAEVDDILKDVYSTMRNEISALRKATFEQLDEQDAKIFDIQKTMWKAAGAIAIVSWSAPFLFKVIFP